MKAEIIAVGTELLLGEILDTNSQYLSQQMSGLGIDLYYISHIGDNHTRLTNAVLQALDRSDLLIMTGGLGPTEDDLTREAIAAALGETMEVQPELENHLRTWYFRRNRPMPERNIKQATLIPSASTIPNPIGTAPGWWVETNGKYIATMPGVPVEMRKMWEEQINPRLQKIAGTGVIATRTLKTVGLGESAAEEVVQPLIRNMNPTLATYAKQDGVHLRMGAKAESRDAAEKLTHSSPHRRNGGSRPFLRNRGRARHLSRERWPSIAWLRSTRTSRRCVKLPAKSQPGLPPILRQPRG